MLELLQVASKIWNSPSLKDTAIIAAQHLMESTLELFRELKKAGLNPNQTFLLGKCYSSSISVIKEFREEGFYVSEKSLSFDSHVSFDLLYKTLIEQFLIEAIKGLDLQKINKIIVLDDGGYLINQLNQISFLKHIPIIGIEQTSAGIHLLEKQQLRIPVLNVARSRAKLELETPFIVDSSIHRFHRYFPKDKLSTSEVLILGNGVIGQNLAKSLEEECLVRTYDPKQNSEKDFVSLLQCSNIIFGCSGSTSLNYEHFIHLKKGTILASVSSSDREFDACKFRSLFPKTGDCRKNFSKDGILLIQSGFPINFWGSRNNIKLKYIQITLSLLMSSIFQALHVQDFFGEIVNIDSHKEDILMAEFGNILMERLKTA